MRWMGTGRALTQYFADRRAKAAYDGSIFSGHCAPGAAGRIHDQIAVDGLDRSQMDDLRID